VIEVGATVAGLAEMHLGERLVPEVRVLNRAGRVVSGQCNKAEDCVDTMDERSPAARASSSSGTSRSSAPLRSSAYRRVRFNGVEPASAGSVVAIPIMAASKGLSV
jgi:hypothetical protein